MLTGNSLHTFIMKPSQGDDQRPARRYSLQPADGCLGMGAAKRAPLGANRGEYRQAAGATSGVQAADLLMDSL